MVVIKLPNAPTNVTASRWVTPIALRLPGAKHVRFLESPIYGKWRWRFSHSAANNGNFDTIFEAMNDCIQDIINSEIAAEHGG